MDFLIGYVMGSRMAGHASRMAVAANAMPPAISSAGKAHDLDDRIDRLAIVVEAMWQLFEEAGYSVEDFDERVAALEEKVLAAPIQSSVPCRGCEAMVPPNLSSCQFCGEPTGGASAFTGIAT
jgi:hypothetical protein